MKHRNSEIISTFWHDDLHSLTSYFSRDSKQEQWKSSEATRNCTVPRQCNSLTFWLIDPKKPGHSEQWSKPSIASVSCSRPKQHENLTCWFGNPCKACPGGSIIMSKRNAHIWSAFRKGRQEEGTQNCWIWALTLRKTSPAFCNQRSLNGFVFIAEFSSVIAEEFSILHAAIL